VSKNQVGVSRASDWPYSPVNLAFMTHYNLNQERDYLTARAALGHDTVETAEAIAAVRREIDRRKERSA
jgi:hypothetical protein